jgi:hypothetical protein
MQQDSSERGTFRVPRRFIHPEGSHIAESREQQHCQSRKDRAGRGSRLPHGRRRAHAAQPGQRRRDRAPDRRQAADGSHARLRGLPQPVLAVLVVRARIPDDVLPVCGLTSPHRADRHIGHAGRLPRRPASSTQRSLLTDARGCAALLATERCAGTFRSGDANAGPRHTSTRARGSMLVSPSISASYSARSRARPGWSRRWASSTSAPANTTSACPTEDFTAPEPPACGSRQPRSSSRLAPPTTSRGRSCPSTPPTTSTKS